MFRPRSAEECAASLLVGHFLEWALCEILTVPLALKGASFSADCRMWLAGMCALALLGVGTAILRDKNDAVLPVSRETGAARSFADGLRKRMKSQELLFFLLLIAIIAYQCATYFFKMHLDEDDSRFVVHAVEAYSHNVLLTNNPATGEYSGFLIGELKKDLVSPWPIYLALAGRISGLHPTILAHTLLPPLYLLLVYLVYWMIGKVLFDGDCAKSLLFTALVAWGMMFYGGHTRSLGDFTLVRIWQGKAALGAIAIPMVFLVFLWMHRYGEEAAWLLIPVNLGGCLLSSMGIALLSVPIAVLGLWYMLVTKKWRVILPLILSGIPTIALGLLSLRLG